MAPDYSVSITLDWLQTPLPCWLTVGVPETLLSLALPLPDPGEHPWPPHPPVSAAWRLQCLLTRLRGPVTPTPGGQLIHSLPRGVWVMVAQHGQAWVSSRYETTPGERSGATTIRKITATPLRASAVITEKGQWHPSVGGLSVPQGGGRCMSPHPLRLRPWHWLWSYDPTDRNKCTLHTSNVEWSSSQGLHMQSSEHITRWQYTQRLNTAVMKGLVFVDSNKVCFGYRHHFSWSCSSKTTTPV